ncbi:MAG: chemotaxis protein [Methylococcaceae bacterium]|nr:chemotaxis protein [Methylococcaceae bacterium]
MKKMQQEIIHRITTAQKLIDEVTRIKIALDNVSTGVMIADNDRKIIYVNKAVVKQLKKIESELKGQLPGFSIDNIIGRNIDVFNKTQVHQSDMLDSSKGAVKSSLVLGDHQFVITTSLVIDEENRRLGTTTEWFDRTQEILVEEEVANAIKAAVAGDFNFRINDVGELGGFYEQASTGINQLMQICNDGLSDVARVLGAMAQGDLTETITNEYSGTFGLLKDNANTTAAKLKDIISQIKDVSDNINTGSKEIASGNNDLSHRTEEQAASLEQTAASMHELTATVQHNFENAKRANDLAINAAKIAGKGGDVVNQVVITMEEINQSSRKIVDIISVIDGIAFQTNILALNAAVEAARAGEQGRGFAVVAAEVRNLAQRAAAAAGEIKNLIGDSVDKVEEGTLLVSHAGKTMTEILDSIRGVTAMMSSIAKASEEQGTGIAQVNMAISQMDDVTQQNAALVEEAAAAAESLEEQAKGLAVMVGTFKVGSTANNSGGSLKGKHEALRPSAKLPVAVSLSDSAWEEF